jgi:hypothetical protein
MLSPVLMGAPTTLFKTCHSTLSWRLAHAWLSFMLSTGERDNGSMVLFFDLRFSFDFVPFLVFPLLSR